MKSKKNTTNKNKKLNIYFTWTELPAYGYFLLKFIYLQLKKKYPINFKVISTDKAVYPINAMGISKAMMEKITLAKSRLKSKIHISNQQK